MAAVRQGSRRALMVQGTTSDAGKSVLVAGLCRLFARRGLSVAPFKPQNMSLNSAVTADGGEIGRAQALQAQASRIAPHTDMNPVLLKPSSDTGAQVIVQGKALDTLDAKAFHSYKRVAMAAVLESYGRLTDAYDYVFVEGAGSPAEVNLRDNDIANMGFAEAVDCPVIIIADIDRGGVFAHLVGTLELLSSTEQARVAGFVINRFRGDIALLQPGVEWLQAYTGKPVLGVLPYLHGLYLDAEDAISRQQRLADKEKSVKVVVPVFSRISNHTDFDALRLHARVDLQFVGPGEQPPSADLIILPGSKNVRADMCWLRDNGWSQHIQKHLRYGGRLLGICGGFQMLGNAIADPEGVEDLPGSEPGLGLLDFDTQIQPHKRLEQVTGVLAVGQAPVKGYEIHCGTSEGPALARSAVAFADGRSDGVLSEDGQILGTYLHGVFDEAAALKALLAWCGMDVEDVEPLANIREAQLDRLADTLEADLDLSQLFPEVFCVER